MPSRDRILISLALLSLLIFSVACVPNPQPEGLTPVPTMAPAAGLTLDPALQGAPQAAVDTAPGPAAESGVPDKGGLVFAQNCAVCHGESAEGGAVGPTLVSAEAKAKDDGHYRQTLANGIAGTAMPAWAGRLSTQDIEDVIAFLRSMQ